MIGVALKGLAGRKIRALLTAFAVVIGVSMVSGTFILTDTMQKSFNGLFDASFDKTDAVIRGKEIVKDSSSGSGVTIPESLLTKVRALPEVEAAGGDVSPQEANAADIIGNDGKAVARESSGGSYDAANARFSPLKLKTGEWPQGAEQVVIDAGTAAKEHYEVGDAVEVSTGGQTPHLRADGHRLVRRRRLARLREHRGLGRQDRPDAARPRGPLRQRLDRGQARHLGRGARRGRQAAPPQEPGGQGQRRAGEGGRRGARRGHGHDPQRSCSASPASRCSSARS